MNIKQSPSALPLNELLEKFSDQLAFISGPADVQIRGLSQPKEASPEDLIVLSEKSHLEEALKSASRIWLLPPALLTDRLKQENRTLLSAAQPKLLLSKIAKAYFRPTDHQIPVGSERIHPTAAIDPSARLGKDVTVGPFAVIGKECVIEDGVVIGAGAVLEPRVHLGRRCHIHPQVFIGHDCELGEECEIKPQAVLGGEGFGYATDPKTLSHHRITHFGRVVLGKRVHIGSGTTIDRGTFSDSFIDDETKIDNLCHFGHNIEIGKATIVTGGVIAAGSVKIGSGCVFGGGTCIAGHLEITDRVHIGGFSGVTKSVLQPGAYGGYPLQPLKEYLRTASSLPSLPKIRKELSQLRQHIFGKEQE